MSETNFGIGFASIRQILFDHADSAVILKDFEFFRFGISSLTSGDGEFTRCGVQQMGNSRYRRVHEMGSSGDGEFVSSGV